MEKTVTELRKILSFKSTTIEGDVVLVAVAEPQSFFYAVVSEITRDENKRDEWWHVTLHVLGLPPQKVVWTLRESQFTGQEIFSMDDVGHFMQAVDFMSGALPEGQVPAKKKSLNKKGRPALRVVK